MGITTRQLETIFDELNERFKTNPHIAIRLGDGDPPKHFEVTYAIKGLHQNNNKEIQEATHHSIAITLPFGFPHFPPHCKPISAIFHPDFDQAAICIGDFWNKNSTLPDLIIHIGNMISGQVFSTENAFNKEAVIWYGQHKDHLPFEIPDFSTESPALEFPVFEEDTFTPLESQKTDAVEETEAAPKPPPLKQEPTFFNKKPVKRFSIRGLFLAGPVVILMILLCLVLYFNNSRYQQAQTLYSACQALLQKNSFAGANQKCNEALSAVRGIKFLGRDQSVTLANNIQTTLNSQKLRQGLSGMVLRNGKYVSKNDEDALIAFNKASDEGDTFMANLSWKEARDRYQQAITILSKISTADKSTLERGDRVRKDLELAQVNILTDEGRQWKEAGDLEKAAIALEKAREIAKSLDNAVMVPTLKSIEPLLFVTQFLRFKMTGDTYFAARDWRNASENYQKALDNAKNIQAPPAVQLAELYENKARAELFFAIESGKEAFNNAQWDEAIGNYESAIRLLKENSAILKQVNSEENRQKLSRIMLQASLIRDKQEVARNLKEGKDAEAIGKLQSIIDTITKSSFNREEEFQQAVKEARHSIAETKKNQLIAKGIAYLLENYKDIILKNYSAARYDSLTDPKATFVKDLGERLLFKIECTDNGQGKPLRLIMNYIYDPAGKQWHFYSDTQ